MDTPILLTAGALLSLAASVMMFSVLLTRKTYPGFACWAVGVFCLALGTAMLVPGALPATWLVRLVRNAMLIGGLMLLCHGLLVFRELAVDRRLEGTFFLSFVVIFAYLSVDPASLDARIATYSTYAALLSFATAFVTLYRRPGYFGSSDVMLAVWLSIYGLLSLSRLVQLLLSPENSSAFEALKGLSSFYALAQILTVQLVALTLISMNSQRIEWEYRTSETRLRESEEKFRQVSEAANDAIALVDSLGRTVFWNRAAERMFGYSAADVLGHSLHDLIAPQQYRASYFPAFELFKHTGQGETIGKTIELTARRKDGSEFPIEISLSAVLQQDQWLAIGIVRDISERKRHELAMRELQSDLQATLDAVPDLLFELDLEGRYYTFHSPRQELLAASPGQLLGRTVHEVLPADAASACLAALQEANVNEFSTGTQLSLDLPIGRRWFELSVAKKPLPPGEIPHFVVISRDITERKESLAILLNHRSELERSVAERTEQLLEAKQAAELANIAKSAFLANMSHEIRTPLNAITGMAYLLRRSGVAPEQSEKLDKILNASEHLLEIVNAVLDLSKIDAGKFSLVDEDLCVTKILDEVSGMVRDQMVAKRIAYHVETEKLPERLRGDATRLKQGLLNYLSNAIKFTEHGSITLRARVIDANPESALVHFEVEDSGPGIASDIVPRLFMAFEQADNSSTRQYGGTGLGLAITRKLAKLMGGDAGVRTVLGEGSTFWFQVRLRSAESASVQPDFLAAGKPEAILKAKYAGKRVLLTEDEPVNQEVATVLLEDVGMEVDLAENGEQAIRRVKENDYALILMDMQMPVMDGLDATRQIRQIPEGKYLPILAMTANAFVEDKARCLEAGMDDFIAKPVAPDMLYLTMLRWLEKSRQA